jgi:hypothetical protein
MRGLKVKALLSINDHPDIRTCFAGVLDVTRDVLLNWRLLWHEPK